MYIWIVAYRVKNEPLCRLLYTIIFIYHYFSGLSLFLVFPGNPVIVLTKKQGHAILIAVELDHFCKLKGESPIMYELLIADDEISSRSILASCFPWEEQGFHICGQVSNGLEALAFLKEHTVHAVLSDISMPSMDGIGLAKELAAKNGSRPIVVFLSAYDNFKYAQEAIRYGVRYYILKPADFSELKEVFNTIRKELDEKFQLETQEDLTATSDAIIQKVLSYCTQNYQNGTLSELADLLYLNASYLSQLIRQKTSKTFSDLLNDARMKQAALLLKDPEAKIYHISTEIGYVNPNNFARAFKAYWGVTPTEYRNHGKSKNI